VFTSEVLTLDVDGHVATLWLDRPDARNALGRAFWRDLALACDEVAGRDEVRVLVIAARGPHFTVGLDLKEFAGITARETASPAAANAARFAGIRDWQASVTAIAELPMPVIAAVHGYCIGGGVDLITACDIRLCSSDAVFSVREAKVAIVADLGTLQRLPRIVGAGHVAELAFTGKDIDAQRAAAIGLVNEVSGSDAAGVLARAYGLAGQIAANSPLAVRGTKAVLAANDGRTVDEGLEFVARWNALYLHSNDLREALTAFVERRAPQFTGD
jgi:enoyl-CoA hydratase